MAEQHEVLATYPDPESARDAIRALEMSGVDANDIRLVDAGPGLGAPTTDEATRDADMRTTQAVGKRSIGVSFAASTILGIVAAAIAWFVSDGSEAAALMAGVGFWIVGGTMGFVYGGYTGMAVSDEWTKTFEAGAGPATLRIVADEPESVMKAVRATNPRDIEVA